MNYSVETIPNFEKEARKLNRKYNSLASELMTLVKQLENVPTKGTSLGNNVYKVRLAIASKGKGKSGGARVITFVKVIEETVYLISIYDKSKLKNLTKEQIHTILQNAGLL